MSKMVISRDYKQFTLSCEAIRELSTFLGFDGEDILEGGSLIENYLRYLYIEEPTMDGKNPLLVWCVEKLGNAAVEEDTQLAVCHYDDDYINAEYFSDDIVEKYGGPVGEVSFCPRTDIPEIEMYFHDNDLNGLLRFLDRHPVTIVPAKS